MTIRYLSLFDGIGAAHVASRRLGWECVALAEIEPAPASVTESHFPDVPNLGDVTADDFIDRVRSFGPIDIIVGGPPCQDFSVAGLRAGIAGDRGNLTLRYLEIIYAIRPSIGSFTENVPGWFSVNDGHAFGAFLGGLAGEDTAITPPRSGWPDAGVVDGPGSCIAWRTLDAQGFVPQRRRRVFVLQSWNADRLDPVRVLFEAKAEAIRHLGDRAHTGPLFPERQGVRGHPATGGSQGEGVASDAAFGVALRGREGGGTAEITGSVMPALRTGGGGGDKPHVLAFGGNNTGGAIDTATALNAHGGPAGRMDFESETFVATVAPTLSVGGRGAGSITGQDAQNGMLVVSALSASGVGVTGADDNQAQAGHIVYSIMPQNSGRDYKARAVETAQPLMAGGPVGGNQGGDYVVAAIPIHVDATRGDSRATTMSKDAAGAMRLRDPGLGVGRDGDPGFTVMAGPAHAVAVTGDITHALNTANGGKGYSEDGTGRGVPTIAYPIQEVGKRTGASTTDVRAGIGIGGDADPMFTLQAGAQHGVAYRTSGNCGAWETGDKVDALTTGTDPNSHILAFSSKDHGADAGELSPTLRAMGHDGSHANAGGQVAVAFGIGSDAVDRSGEGAGGTPAERSGLNIVTDCQPSLRARPNNSVAHAMSVRRLTPLECLRLQGFPDNHLDAAHLRGKPLADGPRYKGIGNSWCVPVVEWIFKRIDKELSA